MSFIYKNPLSNIELFEPDSVVRTSFVGTNYSVLQVGGYQEVFYLNDLKLTFLGTGLQQLSANTIPIQINLQPNTGFNFTTLTLNSDNISSGRRRLGMLVYVHETDTVYQYTIPNYEQQWNTLTGLTGNSGITQQETYTQINARSQAGRDFISLWTGSTIEGVSGVTRNNARWRIFQTATATGATEDVEYVGINCVPGSVDVSAYTVTNNFRDTFVTIPPSFTDKEIFSISASYGDQNSGSQSQFAVELRNSGNTVVNSRSWFHPNNIRIFNTGFTQPLILSANCTMNISVPIEQSNCYCYTYNNTGSTELNISYTGCSFPYEFLTGVEIGDTGSFCANENQIIVSEEGGFEEWTGSPWGGYVTQIDTCYTIGSTDICGNSPSLGGRGYSVTLKISG